MLLGDSLRSARVAVDTGGLIRAEFPKVFVFGMTTLAFQVEGMATGGGREPSI
jgi:beta-glucosidase